MECFSAGTVPIVTSVSNISYKGYEHKINIKEDMGAGEHTFKIQEELLGIQEGKKEDRLGWVKVVR